MRPVRGHRLSEPFRTWIDRAVPLPSGVTVLPRIVNVTSDGLAVVLAVIGCVGIGTPMAAVAPRTEMGAGGWAVFALISAALLGFLSWNVYRLWRTIRARRDEKAGALRLGILVGPEGILVRLTPNRCYPIPMDRFVRAERWSGGGEDGSDYLRVVTLDGPIDIGEDGITADAADLSQTVAVARRRTEG